MINSQEYLFSVDENNTPIKPQLRSVSHAQGIWHRTSHIWIFNNKGEVLCQQRSLLKDSNPGKWEPFFGGHLSPEQTYLGCALEELNEELGLTAKPEDLQEALLFRYVKGTEFQQVYRLVRDIDITTLTLEPDEVEQVAWRSIADVHQQVVVQQSSDWTVLGYEKDLLSATP